MRGALEKGCCGVGVWTQNGRQEGRHPARKAAEHGRHGILLVRWGVLAWCGYVLGCVGRCRCDGRPSRHPHSPPRSVARKNPRKLPKKLEFVKYDPRVNKHVLFTETKLR